MASRFGSELSHAVTLKQMRAFILTVENRSVSSAARVLGVSQSAVSQQLQELERTLHVKLLERAGIRLLPTSAGRALIEPIRRALSAVDLIEPAIAELRNPDFRTVRLGTGATACIHFLPEPLSLTRAQIPNLQILVVTGNSDDIVSAIEDGSLDVGLVTGGGVRQTPMVHIEDLLPEDLVGIVPKSMAHRVPEMLRPRDLAELPLILFDPAGQTRSVIDSWFKRDGIKPVAAMELGSIEAIKTVVGAGLGASLIPRLAIDPAEGNVVYRRTLQPIQRQLCLVMRADKVLNVALRTVLSNLRAAAAHSQLTSPIGRADARP